jgi:hypothetical protein
MQSAAKVLAVTIFDFKAGLLWHRFRGSLGLLGLNTARSFNNGGLDRFDARDNIKPLPVHFLQLLLRIPPIVCASKANSVRASSSAAKFMRAFSSFTRSDFLASTEFVTVTSFIANIPRLHQRHC